MAWLHAAPKQHDKDENPKPRLKTLADNHPAKVLPEADIYLVRCFESIGFCLSGGMGAVPLTWQEIKSFSEQSGYHLNGWESEQIRSMSTDYCGMLHKAKELGFPPPYQEGITEEEELQQMRDRVAKQWESFGDGLKADKNKRA